MLGDTVQDWAGAHRNWRVVLAFAGWGRCARRVDQLIARLRINNPHGCIYAHLVFLDDGRDCEACLGERML